MKTKKFILPLGIATVLLAVLLSVSFIIFDSSEDITIKAKAGSYAQTYAQSHNINFELLSDSEIVNANISDFEYNYQGDIINITVYKGSSDIVTVPETVEGKSVELISFEVLGKGIKTVVIPSSVRAINTDFTSSRYSSAFICAIVILIIAYLFCVAATFIGLAKADNAEKTFYGVPIIYNGMVSFIIISVWSIISMITSLPVKVQIIVNIILFAFAIVSLLKTTMAREFVEDTGKKVKAKTAYIKMLTADAEALLPKAQTDEMKALCNKVYEAIRYSAPMSCDELAGVEAQISLRFNDFSSAIDTGDMEMINKTSSELLVLVNERNRKCKVLK